MSHARGAAWTRTLTVKVLDISGGIAGAYCAHLLTLLGADVVRIDAPAGRPRSGPAADEVVAAVLERGKRQLALDLEEAADREQFLDLVAKADVLIDDAPPAEADRRGLDPDALFARQPSLVLTRITDFGLDGPWAAWHGSELVNLATGGLLFLTGSWDRPPVQLAPDQAHLSAGLLAALATAAALYAGGPALIDLSKQEAVMALVAPSLTSYAYTGVIEAREGKVAGMTRIERSADGWVYAGPSSPTSADYSTFAAFLGIPQLAEPRFATPDARMEHWDEHQALIVPRLRERTAKQWVDDAAAWRLTFGYVQTTLDLLQCPALEARRFFTEVPTQAGTARVPAAPYLVDGERPAAVTDPVPPLLEAAKGDDDGPARPERDQRCARNAAAPL
jgi:crotonobetainyl-CoA:carnitine CoA-transferase CaiB-like acyl-CoA transferase